MSSVSVDEIMGFVRSMLSIARLHPRVIEEVCGDSKVCSNYTRAFTHPSEDPVYNYELYEFLGDSIVNSSIVKYVYAAYPDAGMEHVQVLARLKILMASKVFIFRLAERYGFRRFIRADAVVYETDIRATMEDVFEAFFGCTYCVFNDYREMSGDSVCYRMLSGMLSTVDLPLSYDELVDPVTRLKELMDTYTQLRSEVAVRWVYDPVKRLHTGTGSWRYFSASSTKHKKADAHQVVSEQLLAHLASCGYSKSVNPAFNILMRRVR